MMLTKIRKLLAPPIFEGEEEKTRIARLLNGINWSLLILILIISPPLIILSSTTQDRVISLIIIGIMLPSIIGTFRLMHRGRPRLASVMLMILLSIIFIASTIAFGLDTASFLFLVVMASILLGRQGIIISSIAAALSILVLYWLEKTYESIPIVPLAVQSGIGELIIFLGILAVTAILMGFAFEDLTDTLKRARSNEQKIAASNRELRTSHDTLQATAANLERRNRQILLASEIAQDAAAAQTLEQALKLAVDLLQTRLGFYNVSLFLVDEKGEYAMLKTSAGHKAKEILKQEYQVNIGGKGALGQVTATGNLYHVRDTEKDAIYVKQPLLPETRSELMLPMRIGDKITGAIGVLSKEANAFDENDIAALQAVANQLASTIENARLLARMRQTMREMEIASGQYTQKAWGMVGGRSGKSTGYRYRGLGVEPALDYSNEARAAWQQKRPVVASPPKEPQENQGGTYKAAVPIKFRDQVIGVFGLSSKEDAISPETLSLVEEAANRLALALENARLLEQTQRRAARERLIADISTRVRETLDINTVLETTVNELYEQLGLEKAAIHLATEIEQGKEV